MQTLFPITQLAMVVHVSFFDWYYTVNIGTSSFLSYMAIIFKLKLPFVPSIGPSV